MTCNDCKEVYITDMVLDKTQGNMNCRWIDGYHEMNIHNPVYSLEAIDLMGAVYTSKEPQINRESVKGLFGSDDWIDEGLYGYYSSVEDIVNILSDNLNEGYNIDWVNGDDNERTRRIQITKTTDENIVIGNSPANNRLLDVLGISKDQRGETWDTSNPLIGSCYPKIYPINNIYMSVEPLQSDVNYSSSGTSYNNNARTFVIPSNNPGSVNTYENYQSQRKCLRYTIPSTSIFRITFRDIYGNICMRGDNENYEFGNYDWTLKIRLFSKLNSNT